MIDIESFPQPPLLMRREMKEFSRQVQHIGINFILIPSAIISNQSTLAFQQAIRDSGLDFSNVSLQPGGITVIRENPSPLQIVVSMGQPPIGQLAIIAPFPKTGIGMFINEARAAVEAFKIAWPSPAWQIIKCDATIRELHETESEHAFKELWESRLKQSPESLRIFGKPVRGGGLRFVFDPTPDAAADPVQIEVKIESFLNDSKKIYVETQFIWIAPSAPSPDIDVENRLQKMNDYIDKRVTGFIRGETNGN
jgi:hypothetical protein